MKIFGLHVPFTATGEPVETLTNTPRSISGRYGTYGQGHAISFDGEKNFGEIGPIVKYRLDHAALRLRSWEAMLTSPIASTVITRSGIWIIGKGLKLQSEPAKNVLISEGIDIDVEKFNNLVEARWNIWAKSTMSSWDGMLTLGETARETRKNSKVAGDILVVMRFKKKKLTIELVDGSHVSAPFGGGKAADGNKVVEGVETDATGKHIAYHVAVVGSKSRRIPAWSKSTGLRMAFLVYGGKYRMDNVRGLPTIATSLETIAKIERYKEATVGSAEERQKIAFTVNHNSSSDGENPMAESLASMLDADGPGDTNGAIPIDQQGEALANTVSASTGKEAWNLPIGSELKMLESKNELFFKEFYETNANIICAAANIPPNVAFSMYNNSFSASRAATKDWEHTMGVERDDFQNQFYNPIYAFWFHTEVLAGKIQAPGYLVAFATGNRMVTQAYINARFTGPNFPHIDPLKEAKAVRTILGTQFDHVPMGTVEWATDLINGSDANSNIEQAGKELAFAAKNGIIPDPQSEPVDDDDDYKFDAD